MAKTGKIAIALNINRFNKNSFIAIICALEKERETEKLPVYFLDSDKKDCKTKLTDLEKKFEKIIFMWSFSSFSASEIFRSIKGLKNDISGNLIFMAGGPHSSGEPIGTLQAGFDYVVIGEGEKTVRDFFIAVLADEDTSRIKGLGFLKDGKFIYTGKQPPVDLNDYPSFSKKHRMIGPLEITRGCPWGCRYCQTSYLFGRVPRHRNIAEVKKYAEKLKCSGMKDIRFVTPNALSYGSSDGKSVDLKAIEELLRSVKEILGPDSRIFFGSFPSEVRPEQVSKEVLGLLKNYCNNNNLIIGAQSGSQRILDRIQRGHAVEDTRGAVRLAVENGFNVNVDFIFGLPGEKKEDREKTFQLMEDLIGMGAVIHGHAFMPLPGTPFSKEKPAAFDVDDRKRLKKLEAEKKLYGSWENQVLG